MRERLSGRCLCGAVRFTVRGPFGPLRYCHCVQCRQLSGSAFSANVRARRDAFAVTQGQEAIAERETPRGHQGFCSRCGSPLYGRSPAWPDEINLRLGTFEGDPGVRPVAHVWVSEKAPWLEIDDDLPRFEGAAPA